MNDLKRRVTSDGTPYVDGYDSPPSPELVPPLKRAKETEQEVLATGTPAVASSGGGAPAPEATVQNAAKAEAALPSSPPWQCLERAHPEERAFVRNLLLTCLLPLILLPFTPLEL